MSITGSLIIFVLIWWIIFFSLLPIDVDRKHKEMVEGVDKGSPENPKIIKKNNLYNHNNLNYFYRYIYVSEV